MIHWFHVFTHRQGSWVVTAVPEDEHLWDLFVAFYTRHDGVVVSWARR